MPQRLENSVPEADLRVLEPAAFGASGKKVLVIDDSRDILIVIAEYLRFFGFQPCVAESGEAGIQIAKEQHPDLIICDVTMEGMDGYATLKALRQDDATATIPFIFLTGVVDKTNMRKGMELGADDYLTKPFTHKELMAAVHARLEKQAEVKRQSEKKLDELRGNISLALPHELRTPLNGILGLAQILIDEHVTLPSTDVLEYARCIHESALRLHRLIENFLVYSQIELMASESKAIDVSPAVAPVDVAQLVSGLVLNVAARYQREGDVDLDVTPARVLIPPDKLSKIVEELVDNAFKFSERGNPVRVTAETADHRLHLTVMDCGRGLTAEQISRIGPHMQFERQTYEQQGAGLGLVIAKRLTELLGGQFALVSRPGKHTSVRVSFRALDP